MSDEIHLTEHWSGPVRLQCLADGVAYDLSGLTVSLVLFDKNRFQISTTGVDEFAIFTSTAPAVITATDGYVQYLPTSHDFSSRRSPYNARVKVVDGFNRIVYFPSAASSVWTIYAE